MLSKVIDSCQFVVDNAKHVKINYDKVDALIEELSSFENIHYLTKVPYPIYDMELKDLINFLLIYDALDYSFWGTPKWTIQVEDRELDGGMALMHCIYNLFAGRDSRDVYNELENMSYEEFATLFKGNVEIPLLDKRYRTVKDIAKIVNGYMNGSFYDYIKGMTSDREIFAVLIEFFFNFHDARTYQKHIIHFYKLAQLLTSDILHVLKIKEGMSVDYTNLSGCADYKIPQVLESFGILEYDEELSQLIDSRTEILENSSYEIEIRASMIIVINYLWELTGGEIAHIDINDFIWSKGQDKSKKYRPYHLTRTTSY